MRHTVLVESDVRLEGVGFVTAGRAGPEGLIHSLAERRLLQVETTVTQGREVVILDYEHSELVAVALRIIRG